VDKGIGISEDKQKKIFDFSQKQTTKGTQNETGTGLGLLLCKEFVDKHNGEILIKSKVNEGSTFTIKIPQPTVINY